MKKNYYEILGVDKNATQDDIKKAFRKLAHEHHPDKKTGNADKFKEASEAYTVLSDEDKRKQYDQMGSYSSGGQQGGGFNPNDFGGFDFSGFQGGQGGGIEFDLGDIFGDIFGGGQSQRNAKGRDISVDIEISFKDSIFGVQKTVELQKVSTCTTCKGDGGKPGTKFDACNTCKGKGTIQEMRRSIIGSFATNKTCETCHGAGKIPKEKCDTCKGHGVLKQKQEITFSIPAGINSGESLRIVGQGEASFGKSSGDLFVRIFVQKDKKFTRASATDLSLDLDIKLTDALLGATHKIETVDGVIDMKIPEGVTHGDVLRIKGKGVPYGNGKRGDILVTLSIDIPKKLSRDVKKIVEDLREMGV